MKFEEVSKSDKLEVEKEFLSNDKIPNAKSSWLDYLGMQYLYIFILVILVSVACTNCHNGNRVASHVQKKKDYSTNIKEAEKYCKRKKLNRDFFFLIDLAEHSGYKRFYQWDFNKKSFVDTFMVSHGCGNKLWGSDQTKEKAEVSNQEDSHKSSVGKYIIGEKGVSQWGINVNYRLYGQESTNRNACKRAIVLHSWDAVKDEPQYPKGTPEGWGCPAVSNNAMRKIDKSIKSSRKKTLLWVLN